MNAAILTSVSANIADLAALTMPNKLEYCLRHGYSLVIDNQPYEQAVANMQTLLPYLDRFDLLWGMDADTVITNMAQPLHELWCLGPHVTVCEEGIVEWSRLNCGSVVYRSTPQTRWLIEQAAANYEEWRHYPCIWQTWLEGVAEEHPQVVTVAPLRSFNSCVWNRPANARDEIGGHWQPGDLVYHPCGVFPMTERMEWIKDALTKVLR